MSNADSSRLRRLRKEASNARQATETNDIQVYTIDNISSDNTTWHVTIVPPNTSLYHGGKFKLVLNFPPEYPVQPPFVRFETKIFHPNVEPETGNASFCETGPEWCPAYTGDSLIRSIVAGMDNPQLTSWRFEEPSAEGDSGAYEVDLIANGDAAELWSNNREDFETRVAEWLVLYSVCEGEDEGFVLV